MTAAVLTSMIIDLYCTFCIPSPAYCCMSRAFCFIPYDYFHILIFSLFSFVLHVNMLSFWQLLILDPTNGLCHCLFSIA